MRRLSGIARDFTRIDQNPTHIQTTKNRKYMKLIKMLPVMVSLLFATSSYLHAAFEDLPIANAGDDVGPIVLPASGSVNVPLDGSFSYDQGDTIGGPGGIVNFTWTLTVGSSTTTQTGFAPTFSFNTAGIYTVVLVVTDTEGNTATDSVLVTITNQSTGNLPLIITPAQNQLVECDGAGNQTALNTWLAGHGGSVSSFGVAPITWTNNFDPATSWQDGVAPVCEQAPVIFTATDATGVVRTTTATFQIKDTTAPPLYWHIDGAAVADFTILTMPLNELPVKIKVIPADLCSSSTLQKSYCFLQGCGTVSYSSSTGGTANDTVTLHSASSNAKVRFYFKATDECGNSSATEWVEIDIAASCKKLKGNEGLGNGVDPDTPGSLHNGNNDAPGNFPGRPGARNKRR
jgi:PKD repeat protein